MSNNQQLKVPALLIEQCGTGEDTIGIIGKRIRIVQEPGINPLAELVFGPQPTFRLGAEGMVIHVDAEGAIWVDFGDDERADIRHAPDGEVRIFDVGNVDPDNKDFVTLYELVA